MGIKMRNILTITLMFFHIYCFSQVELNYKIASSKREKVELLKEYALCDCLYTNYIAVDSTFRSKDASKSFIFQVKLIDHRLLDKMEEYTRKNTSNYYKMPAMESIYVNYIFLYCIEFYKSKELHKFIKKELKKHETISNKIFYQ